MVTYSQISTNMLLFIKMAELNLFNGARMRLCSSNPCQVPVARGTKWAQSKVSQECKHCDRIKKCERPEGPNAVYVSLSLVILHQRFPQWQFIIALPLLLLSRSLSVASLTLPAFLLHLPYNPSCESARELLLQGLKIPAPRQWSVTWLCQLPDPSEPFTLAHLCQSHFFNLEPCHVNLALPKPNMTHVS